MRAVLPFILCGGSGTRLWPLSRESYPKQFHKIAGAETLFALTCRRLTGDLFGEISILSNERHRFLIAEQLQSIGLSSAHIYLEPAGRNTAPAACIAALIAARADPESIVLLAPADHVIPDEKTFAEAIASGIAPARGGALVTFGVEPDCPHTGYGYIETDPGAAPLKVKRFVEKPSKETAEAYLNRGNFYWNAGIFLFRAAMLVELMEKLAPDILAACCAALDDTASDLGFHVLGPAYAKAPSISIDYAIVEKADNIVCVPLASAWSDVGSWSEIWAIAPKDAQGNAVQGEGKVILQNASNSLAYSDRTCVALVGVDNLVVVAMGDVVLVAAKEQAEAIKSVVETLRGAGEEIALQHDRVHRPWGWYQGLNRGERYQVKCIMVKPGGTLSLQSHHHRSEHWVVVRGTLEVTKADKTILLTENQSTYIPLGEQHRLSNPGKIPAFLIEVQSGAYLGEDDIVRFEDIYHRTNRD